MRNHWLRIVLCVIYCSASLTTACLAQKADDWPIQNALIGPDSIIEIRAGSSYQARAMYPVPDGPLFPLKARVTWSIEPAVRGISIDSTGKVSVDAAVSHGATAIIHADVESGRRKLSTKVYVFHPEENPLIGAWHVDTRVVCGETREIKAAAVGPLSLRGNNWKFHVSQQLWVGKEHNIAAGVKLTGSYELDLKAAKIKIVPTWPKKPESNWTYLLKDADKTLILQPLEPQDDLEPGCGYILLRKVSDCYSDLPISHCRMTLSECLCGSQRPAKCEIFSLNEAALPSRCSALNWLVMLTAFPLARWPQYRVRAPAKA